MLPTLLACSPVDQTSDKTREQRQNVDSQDDAVRSPVRLRYKNSIASAAEIQAIQMAAGQGMARPGRAVPPVRSVEHRSAMH